MRFSSYWSLVVIALLLPVCGGCSDSETQQREPRLFELEIEIPNRLSSSDSLLVAVTWHARRQLWEWGAPLIDSARALYRSTGGPVAEADFLLFVSDNALSTNSVDSSYSYLIEAFRLYRSADDQLGEAYSSWRLSNLYANNFWERTNEDSAHYHKFKALEYFSSVGDKLNKARILLESAGFHDFDEGIEQRKATIREALAIFEDLNTGSDKRDALQWLANTFLAVDAYDSAEHYWFNSMAQTEPDAREAVNDAYWYAHILYRNGKTGLSRVVREIMLDLGRQHYENDTYGTDQWALTLYYGKDYREAIIYYQDVIRSYMESDYADGIPLHLQGIGDCYSQLGILDSALLYFDSALTVGLSLDDKGPWMFTHVMMVGHFSRHEDFKKAHETVAKVLAFCRANEDQRRSEAHYLRCHADVHFDAGEISEAADTLRVVVSLSRELSLPQYEAEQGFWLGRVETELGNLESAKANFMRSAYLYDSLGDSTLADSVRNHLIAIDE